LHLAERHFHYNNKIPMFRKLALFCVFLTFCLIVLGAYARISDAGLGCPDWPGCYGKIVVDTAPPMSGASVTDWKVLGHRYLAGGLGFFLLALSGLAWRVEERRAKTVALSLSALVLVGSQSALGLWATELPLVPVVIEAHLLAGWAILGLVYWIYLVQAPGALRPPSAGPVLRWTAGLGLLALLVEIALGTWTSVNYAGLACPDFPTCLGSYNPPVDYVQAFRPTHAPSAEGQVGMVSFSVRAAIHWMHRIGTVAVFLLLSVLAMGISSNRSTARLSKAGVLLSFLVLATIALGIAAVMLRLPVIVAVAHSAFAALLLLNLIHINYFLRAPRALEWRPPEAEIPSHREVAPPVVEIPPKAAPEPLFNRLKSGLGKTRTGITGFLGQLALGKKTIDRGLLEDIEAQLLMADIGVTATNEIIQDLTDSLERNQLGDFDALTGRLREHLYELIEPCSRPLVIPPETRPFVVLVVGVNGVGKTTTIGKLAKRLQTQGHSVMLAAGDTFRAAAVEQLQTWGERNQIQVIAQHTGADSASVIFDAVQAAQSRGVDVLIADTAGRLHTKSNLMEELRKIRRIIGKIDETAPHEVLLVLDAGTGQNAISQAKQFNEAVGLTGIALTKLDGTAKGGVIFALAKQFGLPIRYIGIGEGIDDLQDFDAGKFIDALFAH
jgi:fused signal recognition particle receptor